MLKAEVVRTVDDKIVETTVLISRDVYPVGWACGNPQEYYSQMLIKEDNIHVVLHSDEKEVGFLFAIPHNIAVDELKDADPLMKPDSQAYYIENVAVLQAYRKKGAFSKMLSCLKEELKQRDISRISLHARVSNSLSRNIQRNMNIVEVRRIERWQYYDYKEPTDYIVAEW
ncbi:MAG TPA: GNAT family N-acetyltransferase [Syntrophorhabdaceae bacterium]|nr:GNAT family N-acetyltransferase [Syntrophorhabdaceae bacterium]